MSTLPLHELYNQTVGALQRGRAHDALAMAEEMLVRAPGTVEVHQLAGLALTKLGRIDEALAQFAAALRQRPADPSLLSGTAAALMAGGDPEQAISLYRRALVADERFHDALVGLALACTNHGRVAEGRGHAARATDHHPASARAWQALGLAEMTLGNLGESANAFEQALTLAPNDLRISLGRAQVESDRGGDARPFYQRALAISPDDEQAVLGLARAELMLGNADGAERMLDRKLRKDPLWIEGHRALARLRWQAGGQSLSESSLDEALNAMPEAWELHSERIGLLQASQQWERSLSAIEDARSRFAGSGAHRAILLQMEFVSRDELGDRDLAAAALEQIDIKQTSLNFRLAAVRHWLRSGEIARAADYLESQATPEGHGAIWAYLAAAWRHLGDARWHWLEGDERFVQAIALDLGDLPELATVLRQLHTTKSNPFDQSLRGGTQTDGLLLGRNEAPIQNLRKAIHAAVGEYIDALPPPDPTHPLLSRKGRSYRISGSWSVRLDDGGFHISHIHPDGWISSAFYVSLPDFGGGDSGCLVLGEPPADLHLGLGPVRTIAPEPGRLVLFPSYMWHGTRPFSAGERLTVAFDVVADG